MKKIVLAFVALAMAATLAACSSGGGPSASGSGASAASSASESSSSTASENSPSSAAALDAEDVVSVLLDYNAGTGYEWQCSAEPEDLVAQIGQTTEDLAEGEDIAGGSLQDRFTFRAQKPGEVVLTFELVRSWEDDPAETQVYAFTISDDLKMTLNPYKSNFENEPEWSSNS